jgi:hypothetical protein
MLPAYCSKALSDKEGLPVRMSKTPYKLKNNT